MRDERWGDMGHHLVRSIMFGKGGQGTTDCIGCGLPAKLDCKDRFTGDGESSQSYPL